VLSSYHHRALAFLVVLGACGRTNAPDPQCIPTPDMPGIHSFRPLRVDNAGMAPALDIGNYVLVHTAWAHSSRPLSLIRGEIVAFNSIQEPGLIVFKRVIALALDTILMRHGQVLLNGQALAEPYAVHRDSTRAEEPVYRAKMREWQEPFRPSPASGDYDPGLQEWGPLVVPAKAFLALGDNRDSSYDSRYFGFVPDTSIIGRVTVVIDLAADCVRWVRSVPEGM
jgi:signal peptidase I